MVNTTGVPQMRRQDTDVMNPPKKVAMLTAGGLAPPQHLARGGREQPVQQPQKQALAAAIGPHHDGASAWFYPKVDAVDQGLPARCKAQGARLQQRLCHKGALGADIHHHVTHRPPAPPRRAGSSLRH